MGKALEVSRKQDSGELLLRMKSSGSWETNTRGEFLTSFMPRFSLLLNGGEMSSLAAHCWSPAHVSQAPTMGLTLGRKPDLGPWEIKLREAHGGRLRACGSCEWAERGRWAELVSSTPLAL